MRRLFLLLAALTFAPALPTGWESSAEAARGKSAKKRRRSVARKKRPAVLPLKQLSPDPTDDGAANTSGGPPPTRGPTRIDFDDRLVQGQTNKSGAVYLYDRKELKTRSMVKKRDSFREEIVTSVYDQQR